VSSNPCGECSSCRDIDAGRFVDLLEIDAASRTKVDDTRDLLENVVYAPARGRYKVYLIDEVHMLSGHSFNALLKTLEEPPEHVKFLLATTDPQKLPVTVLSRCLQFNLRRLSEDEIEGQLRRVVEAEGMEFEADALVELARAGNGSMRDALSLLDQAIAHGGGALRGADVRGMLGTIARADVLELARAVSADDAAALLGSVDRVAEFAPDFGLVMDELARMLHRIALTQALGETKEQGDEASAIASLAAALSHEEAQLLYQLAITGRRDLALAPSPRAGFEMALLRMLTFRRAAAASDSPEPVRAVPTASVGRDAAPERARPPPSKPYAVAKPAPPAVKEPPPASPPARDPPVREPPAPSPRQSIPSVIRRTRKSSPRAPGRRSPCVSTCAGRRASWRTTRAWWASAAARCSWRSSRSRTSSATPRPRASCARRWRRTWARSSSSSAWSQTRRPRAPRKRCDASARRAWPRPKPR
jgi:DNA polymerase-3 subunit gamma/tau